MPLDRAIYRISYAGAPDVSLTLGNGGSEDDAKVVTSAEWQQEQGIFDQLWYILPFSSATDTYELRNIKDGTYLTLPNGNHTNGTPVVGWQNTNDAWQRWVILPAPGDSKTYMLQNFIGKSFLTLSEGNSKNGTKIVGHTGSWKSTNPHQQWLVEKVSFTGEEVHETLLRNPVIGPKFSGYQFDSIYLALPQAVLLEIWNASNLETTKWRPEIFDNQDFAFVFKAEVAKWGAKTLRADGFGLLLGIMFGQRGDTHYAANWTIDLKDPTKLLFLEPQDGEFGDEPWGSKAYLGIA
ncbi:carbohydrate-binding module family 13 protein [Plicaturopsis crispa FD-325 SS-3]|nr:carbohydrate-binding module family 13 protein [Plicaturopsis crispa FD-325 SS-3]